MCMKMPRNESDSDSDKSVHYDPVTHQRIVARGLHIFSLPLFAAFPLTEQ